MPHPILSSQEKNNTEYSEGPDCRSIQKLIKNGSQVLGKARQRPKVTRGQMLKDLNEKKDKMSSLVEAAHATRCTSNEKQSSTKKTQILESNRMQQAYTASHAVQYQHQINQIPLVSSFNLVTNGSNGHS